MNIADRWQSRLSGAARFALVGGVGALAAVFALGVASGTSGRVGPGTVEIRASVAARGTTIVQLPPLGSIAARTHAAPVALHARVEEVAIEDVQRVLRARDPLDRLEADVARDLAPLLRRFALRVAAASVVAGAIVAAALPHRRRSYPIVGAIGGLIAAAAVLGASWAGFDVRAFREPRFEGPIDRAPSILRAARRHVDDIPDVRLRLEALADRVAGLYAAAALGTGTPGDAGTRILHISDIHSNPVGLELVRRLAAGFQVDAVLDTGDLTSFGLPIEARIGDLVAGVGVPYLFVPGNHDSPANRDAIARVAGVRVLDGSVVSVGPVRILGVADPTFTATNETTTEEAQALKRERAQGVATLAATERPDVLAVHDPVLASTINTEVPVVAAGHTHKRRTSRQGTAVLLTVGSTGATGLDSFLVRADLSYEAQILNFDGARLVSIDYISLTGLDGNFRVEHRLIS